jgi:hypothetical protein
MTQEEINKMGKYILTIIASGKAIPLSWGISSPSTIIYEKMASLKFKVQGYLYTGDVIVSYNVGDDAFEVFTFKNGEVRDHLELVYLNELVKKIDIIIETKNDKSKEYHEKTKKDFIEFFSGR